MQLKCAWHHDKQHVDDAVCDVMSMWYDHFKLETGRPLKGTPRIILILKHLPCTSFALPEGALQAIV
jgi:hypothetical protein